MTAEPAAGEVIDLTITPPPTIIDLAGLSDGETPSASASTSEPAPKRRKARRKKARGGAAGESEPLTNGASVNGAGGDEPRETTGSRSSLLDRLADGTSKHGADAANGSGREKRRKRKHTEVDSRAASGEQDKDIPGDALFFEDAQREEAPSPSKPGPSKTPSTRQEDILQGEEGQPALLLPSHVSVFGQDGVDPVEILPPAHDEDDAESYIEYLDYDDDRKAPGMVRYFEEPAEEAKPTRVVCKNCGAEGEHKTYECPVLICLTCGARDEHSTRSCPISKTCFTCGMKGHINKTCPNRHTARGMGGHNGCDRCGARTHKENECPTLWRMYDYVDDGERQAILAAREKKRTLGLGRGGEGYIATDEWCYGCGYSGHLGDDCRTAPRNPELREPSAFGAYNTLSGPFATDAEHALPAPSRPPRDWEVAGAFADGHGARLPTDVGRQGRRKERQRLEKRARETQEDEEEDWFGSRRREQSGGQRRAEGRRMEISLGGGQRRSGGSLLDRLDHGHLPAPARETDTIHIRGASRRHEDRDRDRDRRGGVEGGGRSRGGDRREDWRNKGDPGPRYRGGYR